MFGLEEKDKKKKFVFDLEKQIQESDKYRQELFDKTEKEINKLKKLLREGSNEKDFDRLGTLLDGYTALQRVLKRIPR